MLGPLAKVIERPISTEFTKGQEQQLAAVIRDLPGPVLVAWEHKAICEMANFIVGNEQSTPQFWPDDRFDVVWIFEGTEQGWTFSQVPQLLLPGDRPEPIQSSL